jgi:outer membrane protein assembly factor BamB
MQTFTSWIAVLTITSSLPVYAAAQSGGDWPQWRGPLRTGASPDARPPVNWSETSNVKWKVKIPGKGTATPIVWQNQLFIQTAILKKAPAEKAMIATQVAGQVQSNQTPRRRPGQGGGGGMRSEKPTEQYQFTLMCLDRNTGATLWQKAAREEVPHEGHHPDHGFASYSPVTDGKLVFAYFGSRGLHCYDLKGNLKWEKDLGRMKTKMSFGEGSSAALFGDTIVVQWDHEGDDFIAAFDTATGKERWRQPRNEETSWATPLIVRHGNRTEVITDASGKIRSYDFQTGKPLWECGPLTANVIPSPVAGDGIVYCMSGFRGNMLYAIKLGGTGDITGTDAVVWKHDRSTPYVPSPVLTGNLLYFLAGNNGTLSCFDAKTGKANFEGERIEAVKGAYASPVAANGHLYVVGRNGATVVLKEGTRPEVVATNKLDDGFDASPAIAGNELFLRGRESLYCLAEK